MENKVDNKGAGGRIAIVGAIITATAGIITTLVSISGPILDKKLAIEATQTREAFIIEATRVAATGIQMSDTPTPGMPDGYNGDPAQTEQTNLAGIPAFTPAPSGAAAQPQVRKTASGTMLKVGDGWVLGNGLTVQLMNIEFPAGNQIKIRHGS